MAGSGSRSTLAFAVVLALAVGAPACSASGGSGSGSPGAGGSSGANGGTSGSGAAGGAAGAAGSAGAGGAAGGGAGGAAGAAASGGAAGAPGSGGSSGAGAAGGVGGSGGTGGAGGSGGATGLQSLGTLVVLGDSISDGGGNPPFYYNLLKQDLATRYGAVAYHNNAQSGSETSALVGQINGLPSTLPGPVAVCITSGGNDMKANLAQVILGADGPARTAMGNNVKAALDALTAPNHFGAGVEVHVYEGNIYDASDGQGNFSANNCAFGKGVPAIPTDSYFNNWNTVIQTQVTGHGQQYMDMHAYFQNHGFNHPPDWYASDCTHPSQLGHDQLRRFFYQRITGETLP